jgi:flagellar basal body-associated protein FliL
MTRVGSQRYKKVVIVVIIIIIIVVVVVVVVVGSITCLSYEMLKDVTSYTWCIATSISE